MILLGCESTRDVVSTLAGLANDFAEGCEAVRFIEELLCMLFDLPENEMSVFVCLSHLFHASFVASLGDWQQANWVHL